MVSISDVFSFLLTFIPAPSAHPLSIGIPSEARPGLRPETLETKEQSETAYLSAPGLGSSAPASGVHRCRVGDGNSEGAVGALSLEPVGTKSGE